MKGAVPLIKGVWKNRGGRGYGRDCWCLHKQGRMVVLGVNLYNQREGGGGGKKGAEGEVENDTQLKREGEGWKECESEKGVRGRCSGWKEGGNAGKGGQ